MCLLINSLKIGGEIPEVFKGGTREGKRGKVYSYILLILKKKR
jgi:hypothetical protein